MGYRARPSGIGFRVGESSTVQERVLDFVMDNAGAALTESMIREHLGLPKSSINRALSEITAQGLVGVTAVGRTLVYRMDPGDPLIHHLKIARAIARARAALTPVIDLVDLAVLFGSASRGTDTAGSDLDLFVVTSDVDSVLAALARIEGVQPVVVTPGEHMQMIAEGGTFARATQDGIRLGGRRE